MSQERRYASPSFRRQHVPNRRRQIAHRGIQANGPKRIALQTRFSAIRCVPSIYERYCEWDIESALAELKTSLRGANVVLRSKTPELVRQEFHGLMMTHFAIRGVMHEAALKADVDPDRLSFIHAVRVIKRKLPGFLSIPPSAQSSPA